MRWVETVAEALPDADGVVPAEALQVRSHDDGAQFGDRFDIRRGGGPETPRDHGKNPRGWEYRPGGAGLALVSTSVRGMG
ncbi:hypothetical protein GCM10029976_071800 [Kribbella albertanoniae]